MLSVCACPSSFFFSAGGRHTRWPRDWGSDVCSSDLSPAGRPRAATTASRRPPAAPGSLRSPDSASCLRGSRARRHPLRSAAWGSRAPPPPGRSHPPLPPCAAWLPGRSRWWRTSRGDGGSGRGRIPSPGSSWATDSAAFSRRRCLSVAQKVPCSRPLTTEDRVTLDEAKAALQRGRHLVLVLPPDVDQAAAVWELVSAPVVIVCGDHGSAAEWAAAAPAGMRVHAVTGLSRATHLLKERAVP